MYRTMKTYPEINIKVDQEKCERPKGYWIDSLLKVSKPNKKKNHETNNK